MQAHRIQLVIALRDLREAVADYRPILEQHGIDEKSLVGFTCYALGEGPFRCQQQLGHHQTGHPLTYLAHELLSLNPFLSGDQRRFEIIRGNAAAAIEILMQVIRAKIAVSIQNKTVHAFVQERFIGGGVLVSFSVYEQEYLNEPLPRLTAPVF
ncbi:MAG TPA: hypothetical protein VN081_05800 [Dongiaceae bacterium]|nr:hypothetical protein [Dongiaceae bacterium]